MSNINPNYYKGNIECIDAIQEATKDLNGFEAFLTGQVIRYLWRWNKKNGLEDLEKAQWYINKLIEKAKSANLSGSILINSSTNTANSFPYDSSISYSNLKEAIINDPERIERVGIKESEKTAVEKVIEKMLE